MIAPVSTVRLKVQACVLTCVLACVRIKQGWRKGILRAVTPDYNTIK